MDKVFIQKCCTRKLAWGDKACITLFREIQIEDELYPIFHPPFDVVKKYRFEPPNIGLFKDA